MIPKEGLLVVPVEVEVEVRVLLLFSPIAFTVEEVEVDMNSSRGWCGQRCEEQHK